MSNKNEMAAQSDNQCVTADDANLLLFETEADMDEELRKAERARLRAEKERRKREKDALYTAKAIEAFEAGAWDAGLKLAVKIREKNAQIIYWMGRYYEDGYLLDRNPDASSGLYQEAAELGNEEAKRRLARMEIKGNSALFSDDSEWAFLRRCREAAERGNNEAQVAWAEMLDWYLRCPYEESIKWLDKATTNIRPESLYYIGCMFEKDSFFEANEATALELYRKAAKHGDFGAMLKLKYHFNENCELVMPPEEVLRRDFVMGKDGKYHKRVKTGTWLPVRDGWMTNSMWVNVEWLHRNPEKWMPKACRAASLREKIYGKEGPEHEGYGSGALQKWADKMVKEGKDPHYVNLLEWFKGAAGALDYHSNEMDFDQLRKDPNSSIHAVIGNMTDEFPELRKLSKRAANEAMKQKYYTIYYAPYGIPILGFVENASSRWG